MRFFPIIFILAILFTSCSRKKILNEKGQYLVAIQPFGKYDSLMLKELKVELEKRLNVEIAILKSVHPPASSFYKPRQRFIADSLLNVLERINAGRFEKVMGTIQSDISTKNESHANWGVMGLARCPGRACVISSYRVTPSAKNRDHFMKRMNCLALHELGHSFSLPHCKSNVCIMRDAEGKMNLDDADDYCNNCRYILRKKKVLL